MKFHTTPDVTNVPRLFLDNTQNIYNIKNCIESHHIYQMFKYDKISGQTILYIKVPARSLISQVQLHMESSSKFTILTHSHSSFLGYI